MSAIAYCCCNNITFCGKIRHFERMPVVLPTPICRFASVRNKAFSWKSLSNILLGIYLNDSDSCCYFFVTEPLWTLSLNLYWTFKFSSIPPQILSGYIIVAHFLLQSWWHLKERFFFWWFLSSSSVPMCWAFEMRTGSKQLCGIFFVVLCFTKLSNGIACRFSHCFCWTCFSFLFEETSVSGNICFHPCGDGWKSHLSI